jgi:hypothetical protein
VYPARREPLLWLQLLGLAVLPLEALLLILVLAGADPGPFPGFERLLTWALGSLAPAVLFWRLPPDLWSLLLVQVPMRGRRPEQLQLSALQEAQPLKFIAAVGAALWLPLLWRIDSGAGLAWAWSPFTDSPRLVVLLMSVPLLALMQWQWHQLIQALWLFTRPQTLVDQTLPLSQIQAAEGRLNLGIPLLLLPPLAIEAPTPKAAPEPQAEPSPIVEAREQSAESVELEPLASQVEADAEAESEPGDHKPDQSPAQSSSSEISIVETGVAVAPEEQTEKQESTDLDT